MKLRDAVSTGNVGLWICATLKVLLQLRNGCVLAVVQRPSSPKVSSSRAHLRVSMKNSRGRVLQHLKSGTAKDGFSVWDIDKDDHDDRQIILFNVKDKKDRHWLLSLELYLEEQLGPKIKALRAG